MLLHPRTLRKALLAFSVFPITMLVAAACATQDGFGTGQVTTVATLPTPPRDASPDTKPIVLFNDADIVSTVDLTLKGQVFAPNGELPMANSRVCYTRRACGIVDGGFV
jgi:hypothetical protein